MRRAPEGKPVPPSDSSNTEASDSASAPPPRKLHDLAYGLERIGLIPLRAPVVSAIILAVLCVIAALGIERIKVDDSLSQLFRSDTKEFRQYEEVTKRFPSSEFDVLVVVEGKNLMARESIEKLRDLVTDLQLVDSVRGLISLFSARQPPEAGKLPAPVFPETLPDGSGIRRAGPEGAEQRDHPRQASRRKTARWRWSCCRSIPRSSAARGSRPPSAKSARSCRKTSVRPGLTVQLAGVPTMQLEIRNAVERDTLLYNTIGFAAGCLIAIAFFRRISFMIIAAAPPLIAILLSLGALGWLNFSLNMFLNVMTPLIMVISFSDSMQLTFAARDRLIAGKDKYTAFREAVLVVGPACVLTHGTAGISFIALQFSSSEAIRTFGEAGLMATMIALLAVLSLVPLLGVLLIRKESNFAVGGRGADIGVEGLRSFCRWVALRMVSHPGLYSLIGLLVVVGLDA